MKRLFTFLIVVSILSASLWAADVSVTEKFTRVTGPGAINTTTTASGLVRSGDVCNWNFSKLRYSSDVITVGSTNYTAVWLNYVSETEYSTLATTNLEGGIKSVSFRWAQFGKEAGNTLKLKVAAGSVEHNPAISRSGSSGADYTTGGSEYEHTFECKTNSQLTITNVSDKSASGNACRILVCNIAITPYLLYRNKDVTVGLKQRGYANNGSQDFINNTDSEGSVSYSSSATNVATVDGNGVITPKSVGVTTITATWSEGASTTYTLHVVDGIIAENFSKVVQTGQTASATWHGDLWDWSVANVRRGEADTLGLNPRIQATAMRSNTSSTLISANTIEGGVKHITFVWRQWATATSPLTFKAYYSADKENWGEAVATQEKDAVAPSEQYTFSEDIDDGAKGNAYLKIEYTSGSGAAVIGAMKITPYLLYTTKEATLDTRNGLTYINNDLIDNTGSDDVVFTIAPADGGATIIASGENAGQVTAENDEVEGDFTVKAKWGDVETTYILHILSLSVANPSFENAVVRLDLTDDVPANALNKDGHDATPAYTSSNTAVADFVGGVLTLKGVGQTTITATLAQTENYKAATASYILRVEDNSASVQVERFSNVSTGNANTHAGKLWQGDVCAWRVSACGGVRKNNDVFASDQTRNGIWMGTPDPNNNYGSLTAENGIEGGIKHLWFYVEQPYNTGEAGYTLKPVVYLDEAIVANKITEMEVVGTSGAANIAANRKLFGASNVTKNNSVLIIRNESYISASGDRPAANSNRGRILLDEIHITPWMLYTEKTPAEITVGNTTYKNNSLIDNTTGETGTLSYESSNTSVAEVGADGTINAKAPGTVTITAKFKWSESEFVTTTYSLAVVPATNFETFANISNSCIVCPGSSNCATSPVTDELDNGVSWTYWLGGGNTTVFGREAMYLRARLSSESSYEYGYLRSSQIPGGLSSLTFAWNQGGTESGQTYNVEVKVNGDVVGSITAAGQEEVYSTPQVFTVSGLNYKGNVVIEIVNKTAYDGTKSRGRFVIDYLYWTGNAGAIELDEEADNSDILSWNNNAVADVNTNRSLVAGYWNTLCLPFAVSKSADLGGADVQELYSATRDGDDLVVGFKVLNSDELVAGTPYLVKPTSNIDLTSFTGKRIVATPTLVNKGIVTLTGIFSPQALVANDKTTLFVGTPDGAGNNLFYPSTNGNLKGMRAYFKVDSGSGSPVRRARFVVDAETMATEIGNTEIQARTEKQLIDGQLFIIRDGVRYNTIGQIIK